MNKILKASKNILEQMFSGKCLEKRNFKRYQFKKRSRELHIFGKILCRITYKNGSHKRTLEIFVVLKIEL